MFRLSLASKSQRRGPSDLYPWRSPSRARKFCRVSLAGSPSHHRFVHLPTESKPRGGHVKFPDLLSQAPIGTVERHPGQWDEPTEDKTIADALSGRAGALLARLTFYLQQKKYAAIGQLYGRFATRLKAAHSVPEPGVQPDKEDANTQTRALLCAITAHAIEGSFEPLLEIYLKIGLPEIPRALINEHLDFLKTESTVENQIVSYINDLNSAFFVSNPVALQRYVKSLSKSNSSRSLSKLYQGVLNGITRPKPFISACESHQSSLPLVVTEIVWASFLSAFIRCQRTDLAQKLWADLHHLKVRKGNALWTNLIDGFDQLRLSSLALEAWSEMLSESGQPDALTYRAMISVLFKDKQARHALETFAKFQKVEEKFDSKEQLVVYNTVVAGLLRNQLLPQAEKFIQIMKGRGHSPDVVTYNTFLDHYNRAQDFPGILNVVTNMEEASVQGDIYTFSTILSALLRAGRRDATDVVLRCMKEHGVQANAVIYSSLINHQLEMKDEGHLRAALSLLKTMEENKKIAPTNVTYTSFLTHLHRSNWMTPKKREAYRAEVLKRMRNQGIRLTLPDYHILLNASLNDPDTSGLTSARWYYQDIKRRGIPMVNTTCYIMLAGTIAKEEWGIAKEVVKDIELLGINPSSSLVKLMRVVREYKDT